MKQKDQVGSESKVWDEGGKTAKIKGNLGGVIWKSNQQKHHKIYTYMEKT